MSTNSVAHVLRGVLLQHVIRLAVGLVTSLGLARHLGPEAFGSYQTMLSWMLVFIALGSGGLQSVVIQRLAISNAPRDVLGTVFRLRLAWVGLALLLSTVLPILLRWSHGEILCVLVLAPSLFLQFSDLPDYLFQSRMEPLPALLARSSGSLIALAAMGIGILLNFGVLFFCAAFVLDQIVGFVVLWHRNQRAGVPFASWRFDPKIASELMREAWPMLLTTLSLLVYTRIDLVMLRQLSSPEQVGYFAASSRLAQLWAFVPLVLVNAIFPMLARLRLTDSVAYTQKSKDFIAVLGFSGLLLALVLSIGAPWIVPLLLGKDYAPTIPMLAVQGWIALCYFVRTGMDRWLVTERLTHYNLILHVGTALMNVGLNFVLIPRMGGMGAAVASLVSMVLAVWGIPWCFAAMRPVARLLVPTRVPDWRGLLRSRG